MSDNADVRVTVDVPANQADYIRDVARAMRSMRDAAKFCPLARVRYVGWPKGWYFGRPLTLGTVVAWNALDHKYDVMWDERGLMVVGVAAEDLELAG